MKTKDMPILLLTGYLGSGKTTLLNYLLSNRDMSFLFEQAGRQKQITEAGLWYATMPEDELIEMMKREPGLVRDWDERYGDRMQKIVFIGQHLDKEQLIKDLDACLE